jgi:hypothetical protein
VSEGLKTGLQDILKPRVISSYTAYKIPLPSHQLLCPAKQLRGPAFQHPAKLRLKACERLPFYPYTTESELWLFGSIVSGSE